MSPHLKISLSLSDKDSNLDRQNQNLQCCRYTIGHSGRKDTPFFLIPNYSNKKLAVYVQQWRFSYLICYLCQELLAIFIDEILPYFGGGFG